ncbi:MAG: restriction endonuclease subunit R, partial [Nitrospirota bacterium]
ITNHYYVPMILTDEEKIDYITHIIKTQSEVKFVSDLEDYLSGNGNKFNEFDWWFFSKLDETLDEVYIPYYHPDSNRISKFNPDFIFWLKKGDNYSIVFIDPKGIKHTDYMHKVDGYKMIFEEDNSKPRKFEFKDLMGRVYTFLRADDINRLPQDGYRNYWFDNIDRVLDKVLKRGNENQIGH